MINLLFSLVLILIVGGLLYWAVTKLSAAFGFPPPVVTVAQVIIVIVIVLLLINLLMPGHVRLG